MFVLDDISAYCSSGGIEYIVSIIKSIFNLIEIIAPILTIISISLIIIKIVNNPDDKKLPKRLSNSVFALIFVFFIPVIVNAFMYICNDTFSISKCWENTDKYAFTSSVEYQEVNSNNRSSVVSNPNDYEKGNERVDNSSSNTSSSGGNGALTSFEIAYDVKDSKGRCGKSSSDRCAVRCKATYSNGNSLTFYVGRNSNSGLLGGSCRANAFTGGMNALNNTYYSTLDLQKYLESAKISFKGSDYGVLRGKSRFNAVISHYNVNAKAYFNDISISNAYEVAKDALSKGNPVIIFVSGNKCGEYSGHNNHHALLLLGYDKNNDVVFLDSSGLYKHSSKHHSLNYMINTCMSPDGTAHNWMRMVVFNS